MLNLKHAFAGLACVLVFFCSGQNLTIYRSNMSVDETEKKFVELLKEQELVYFETVYHEEIAAKRKFELSPTRVILFEEPDLITRLIKCNQTTALEMPLKMLIWEENEDVYIGFVDPKLMSKRYLIQDCDEVLEDLARLMLKLVTKTLRSSE